MIYAWITLTLALSSLLVSTHLVFGLIAIMVVLVGLLLTCAYQAGVRNGDAAKAAPKAEPKPEEVSLQTWKPRYCNCKQRCVASDGICNWCGGEIS